MCYSSSLNSLQNNSRSAISNTSAAMVKPAFQLLEGQSSNSSCMAAGLLLADTILKSLISYLTFFHAKLTTLCSLRAACMGVAASSRCRPWSRPALGRNTRLLRRQNTHSCAFCVANMS
jgi:hypothetical protein